MNKKQIAHNLEVLRRFIEPAKQYLVEPGWILSHPEREAVAWHRLVGQICAIGSARSWGVLGDLKIRAALSIPSIHQQVKISNAGETVGMIHAALCDCGVRYCSSARKTSAKAIAIYTNAMGALCSEGGEPAFIANLTKLVDTTTEPIRANRFVTLHQAIYARQLMIDGLFMFGPKGASDTLVSLGLTDRFIALDVRLLNLLHWYFHGVLGDASAQHISSLHKYATAEARIEVHIARPLGISLFHLDQILFNYYEQLKLELKGWS